MVRYLIEWNGRNRKLPRLRREARMPINQKPLSLVPRLVGLEGLGISTAKSLDYYCCCM